MRSRGLRATAVLFLLYAAMYGAFGVASPFWPRFFESKGLGPQEVGLLLGLGVLIRLISGPLIGRLADAWDNLPAALAACMGLAAAFALSLLLADAFWSLLLMHLAHMAALAPVTTTADALATRDARHDGRVGLVYGQIRGAASAAFIAGTLATGLLFGGAAVSIALAHAGLLVVAAGAALLFSQSSVQSERPPMTLSALAGAIPKLWAIPAFRAVILVSALIYGSHAVHDAFAVIRWNEARIGPAMASVLWSEAVAAEVLMFVVIGPHLVDRLGTNRAAALAAAAGVVRWCVAATTTSTVALALVQPLHGFTFALVHLVCIRLIGLAVPRHLAATAQGLYAFGAGLMTAVLTVLAGQLYAVWAGAAFLPMALLCCLALPLAWTGLRIESDACR